MEHVTGDGNWRCIVHWYRRLVFATVRSAPVRTGTRLPSLHQRARDFTNAVVAVRGTGVCSIDENRFVPGRKTI